MSFKKLSNRLALAAEFTTDGKIIADIGTDHGSLPIFLVGSGKCPSAVAADLRKGPLESAKSNIEAAGLSDKIVTRLSDGLCGIGPDEFDEAVMAGMGGILICGILENCPYRNDKAFVLQPMSDPDTVRSWLYANGFDITKEKAVCRGKAGVCGHARRILRQEPQADRFRSPCGNARPKPFGGRIRIF